MDITKLLGLRPKLQTAEAIAAAIAQAEALHSQAVAREAELKAGRGALLVNGNAKEVEDGERELADVRAELERLSVMIEALKPQLQQVQKQEKVAAFRKKLDEANKIADELAGIWKVRYPILNSEISSMQQKITAANQQLRDLRMRLAEDPEMTKEIGNYGRQFDDCYERANLGLNQGTGE